MSIFKIKNLNLRFLSQRRIQTSLRNYLIKNNEYKCILCNIEYPIEILETAHLKPYSVSTDIERKDVNIVEFMCRNCHKFYDMGFIGVINGAIIKNREILKYEYNITNKYIDNYHFKKLFKKV
jgi:hypothetical protein